MTDLTERNVAIIFRSLVCDELCVRDVARTSSPLILWIASLRDVQDRERGSIRMDHSGDIHLTYLHRSKVQIGETP